MGFNKRLFVGGASGITATDHFNCVAYTGNGSTTKEVTVGFNPDFVWVKSSSASDSHIIVDSQRGNGVFLSPNAQTANDSNAAHLKLITNGFDAMSNPNTGSREYISWSFKGGGSSNTWNIDGTGYASAGAASLTGTTGASVNTVSGFSIIKYAGSGSANQVIPHGLTDCQLVFVKNTGSSTDWQAFGEPIFDRMQLNNDGADDASHGFTLSSTSITSPSLVATEWNGSGQNYIAYCFTSIDGFQKIDKYTGNGSGQDITGLGFNPRFLLVKSLDSAQSWRITDSVRGNNVFLFPNSSGPNDTGTYISLITNGFRLNGLDSNQSSEEFLYWAIA